MVPIDVFDFVGVAIEGWAQTELISLVIVLPNQSRANVIDSY
jgi:hypothetical protein